MKLLSILGLCLLTSIAISQTTFIEGYIYETGNRGYLSGVDITIDDITNDKLLQKTTTNEDGYFTINVPKNTEVRLYATKDMFDVKKVDIPVQDQKVFVKLEMGRRPGYTFEITLAEKRDNENIVVDAISGSRIEVYNNTKRESVLDLKDHQSPNFQLNLENGNHYTILIRKDGYLSKRMEAFVDVEGCILCFEGVGEVSPGVSDNLTSDNAFGTLLANVELERLYTGKTLEVENLYYDLGKSTLRKESREQLDKVITLMNDNPSITLELGSHTDSRGGDGFNLELSKKRAQSAVNYLKQNGNTDGANIISKGYGETNLKNNCSNGVKCSESEHQENRRTELKIVRIKPVSQVKSLKRMKDEEFFEQEVLSLDGFQQIKAKDEEELKQILQEQNGGEPVEETDAQRVKREVDALKAKKEANKYKRTATEGVGKTSIEKPTLPSAINEDGTDVENSKKQENSNYESVSDGAKVILYNSPLALKPNSPTIKGLLGVEHWFYKNVHYYMLPFDSQKEAFDFYDNMNKKKYRGAFVVTFKNNIMTKLDR